VRRQRVGVLIIESATPHAIICIQLVDSSALEALPASLNGGARRASVVFRNRFRSAERGTDTNIMRVGLRAGKRDYTPCDCFGT
jgi:hypothetical protein